MNLRTRAKDYRTKSDCYSHDEICLFVHFIPEIKQHTTKDQFNDLYERLIKGYLDKELNEKAKCMDPNLTVLDFRFLSTVTGVQLKVLGQRSTVGELEEKAELGELNLFQAKLERETNIYVNFRRAQDMYEAQTARDKRQQSKELATQIETSALNFVKEVAPVFKVSDDSAVLPLVADVVDKWVKDAKISKDNALTCFVVRLDNLGNKHQANLDASVRIISDAIAGDSVRTCAIVFAPNTGRDEVHNEHEIQMVHHG